jgi:hypothetical protein
MKVDDGIRSNKGVICSLRKTDVDTFRLVLDDVTSEKIKTSAQWTHECLFTWKDFDKRQITDLKVSQKDLAEIGFNILARLVALGNIK